MLVFEPIDNTCLRLALIVQLAALNNFQGQRLLSLSHCTNIAVITPWNAHSDLYLLGLC
jgi:hypothetical protein